MFSFFPRFKIITVIFVWPVSLVELNVKGAFIFSLYRNFPIFSDVRYPYLPGIKHSYFVCILSMWLVITWWSLTWSLIHICWILAVKVDPFWKGGVKEKNTLKKAHKNITLLFSFLVKISANSEMVELEPLLKFVELSWNDPDVQLLVWSRSKFMLLPCCWIVRVSFFFIFG